MAKIQQFLLVMADLISLTLIEFCPIGFARVYVQANIRGEGYGRKWHEAESRAKKTELF